MKRKLLFTTFLFSIILFTANSQTTLSISADKDNTLYEDATGNTSNGAGTHLFAGRTKQGSDNLRRAVIKFDLTSVPANAIIDSVSVELNINKVASGSGSDTLKLHRLTSDWGEGTSSATGGGGSGATATTGDATWIHREFNTVNWTNTGGDYDSTVSAFIVKSGTGAITFIDSNLTNDVSNWLDGTNRNYGWIVIGEEGTSGSAKRINSSENGSNKPTLSVTYLLTGLTEFVNSTKIGIYPNPVTDFLRIEHRNDMFKNILIITDINGKEVLNTNFNKSNLVNVSELKAGAYLLRLITRDNNEVVSKFIKQ